MVPWLRGWLIGVGVCLAGIGAASGQWQPVEGSERGASERFLLEATITDSVQLSARQGVTRPHKLTLEFEGETRFALWKNPSGRPSGHVEGWRYEIAAYRLDRYLELGMVPPTVERAFRRQPGSIQAWATYWKDLREIAAQEIPTPPQHVRAYNRAVYLQRAFDNLIANVDRHQGNLLVTETWGLILIDHSRSFRVDRKHRKQLIYTEKHREGPRVVKQLPRTFVDRLKSLDAVQLDTTVGDYLTPKEKQAVLARRMLVLQAIEKRIAIHGEAQILY